MSLTKRELEVTALVVEGMTNKEIAAALRISVSTVNDHVAQSLRKTGTRNRTALATLARRQGWTA